MTYASQIGRAAEGGLPAPPAARVAVRRLPPGIGLAAGARASLGLWAGLIQLALQLIR